MAQVTNSEYQNASNAMNDRYTSDSLQSYTNAYNDYMSQGMSSSEAANKARGLLVENIPTNTSTPSSTSSNTYQNQGTGNYVFNPKTGYYENQTDTTKNTTNQNLTTPQNQTQTSGSTVSENTQSGALKPLSQEYYNQTNDNALNTIRNNLNNYRQTNPEYFTDYDSFKRNFSYDSRNDEQKNLLDEWYKGYTQQLQLSSVPTTDLYTQYKDGQISATELEGLRISNPEKYAELMNQINKGNIVSAYDDDKGADTTGMSIQDMAYNMAMQTFNKFMSGEPSSEASNIFREYENKMESPEMVEISDKTTELQEQIENIQSDLDAIKKSVEEEYAGTGATRSKINAIISDRSYELQLQLRTLNSEYNKYATQYNNRMQQYQNEFSMQLQEYQINQQERQQQMSELGFALDLMNFETNDQKAEREWNYRVKQQEYANGNINSKDYQTRYKAALNSVQNLLSQYPGIPTKRSAEEMAQDILTAIDGGSNLGAELTKINQFMQQKPEYKYLYNQTFKPAASTGVQSYKVGDTEYVVYNNEMMTAEEFNKRYGGKAVGATGNAKQYDLVDSRAMSASTMNTKGGYNGNTLGLFLLDTKHQVGKKGGQCGKFVNDYLQYIGLNTPGGRYYDNDLSTKLNSVNSNIAREGSIAVFDYGHKSSDGINHGHVGIVTKVYDDGSFDMLDSNGDLSKPETIRKVHIKGSSALKGFFDPSKLPAGSGLDGGMSTLSTTLVGGLSDSQITQLAKDYINNERSYSDISKTYGDNVLNAVGLKASQLQESGYSKSTILTDPTKIANMETKLRSEYEKSVADYKETEDWVNKMKEAYNLIDTDKNAASQAIVIAYNKILDPGSVVREGEYARTAEGQSVLGQIQSKLEQMAKGGAGLTKSQLKSLVDVANSFSQNAKSKQLDKAKQIKVSIDKYGLTPEAVLDMNTLNQLGIGTTSTTGSRWTPLLGNTSYTTGTSSTVNLGGWYVPTSLYGN